MLILPVVLTTVMFFMKGLWERGTADCFIDVRVTHPPPSTEIYTMCWPLMKTRETAKIPESIENCIAPFRLPVCGALHPFFSIKFALALARPPAAVPDRYHGE